MKRRTGKAFTLVELMVTMAIIVLAATMVAPLVSALTGGNRVEGAMLEIQGYLAMARQQAVQYNKMVAVRFVPPTKMTAQWRIMIEELKESATDPKLSSSWRVMPGAYGLKLAGMLTVSSDAANASSGWRLWFDPDGFISNDCPDGNLVIGVGPTSKDTIEPKITYHVNRATGQFLKFAPRIDYGD